MSKSGYLTADLIRIALHCAIRDRDAYAICGDGEASQRAADLAADFRAMLMRRYGEAPESDRTLGKAIPINMIQPKYEPMAMKRSEIETRIAHVIRDRRIANWTGDLDPATPFPALGFDSLDHVELVLAVEEELRVSISDEEADTTCSTIAGMAGLIETKLAKASA